MWHMSVCVCVCRVCVWSVCVYVWVAYESSSVFFALIPKLHFELQF